MEKNVHRGGFDPYYALFVYHIQRENYINIDVYVVNNTSRGIPWGRTPINRGDVPDIASHVITAKL